MSNFLLRMPHKDKSTSEAEENHPIFDDDSYLSDKSLKSKRQGPFYKKPNQQNYIDDKEEKSKHVKSSLGKRTYKSLREIDLPDGELEIGLDEKKTDNEDAKNSNINGKNEKADKRIYISLRNNAINERSKTVHDESGAFNYAHYGEKYRSSSKSFNDSYANGMVLWCNLDETVNKLKDQNKAIEKNEEEKGGTVADDVLPFKNIKNENKQIESLQKLRNANKSDNSNINKTIHHLETEKNKKKQERLSFEQKLDRAVEAVKEFAMKVNIGGDYWWWVYLKKRLELIRLLEKLEARDYSDEDILENEELKKEIEKEYKTQNKEKLGKENAEKEEKKEVQEGESNENKKDE